MPPQRALTSAPDRPSSRLLLAVFGLALVLRFGFWWEVSGTPLDRWHEWDQTDMATFLLQARQIGLGDWLAVDPYHPYHSWQHVAPREKWLEWYGPHQFHQAPAYAYAVAVLDRWTGNPLPWVKLFQLALGAFTSVLAAAVAGRLAGPIAAGAAGILAATYGPLFHLEGQLLREGPGVLAMLAITVLLARFAQRAVVAPREIAFFAVPLGAFATFHEMASVLFIASVIVVAAICVRHGARALAIGLATLGLGIVVGFAPLLVRNLAVGAPAFSVSCRTTINFVHANEADAPRGGADFTARGPSPRFVEILDAADGSLPAALAGVWRSYDGDLGRMLGNAGQRFRTIWHRGEIPDNTSYAFFRERSSVLAWLPGFAVVFSLGMTGWALVLWQCRWDRRHGPAHAVFGLVLLGLVSALTLIHPVARFRLYLVPFLWIYAGIAAAWWIRFCADRRLGPAASMLAVLIAALALQSSFSTDPPSTAPRRSDYTFASRLALRDGDLAYARALAEAAATQFPHKGSYYGNLGLAHADRGEHSRALADLERAQQMEPRLPGLREALRAQRTKTAP